jgi:hypothetical protein
MDIYSKNIIGARFFPSADFWRRRNALMRFLFFFLMLGITGDISFEVVSGFECGFLPHQETRSTSSGSAIISLDYDDDYIPASLSITSKPAKNIQFLITYAVFYAEGFDRNLFRPPSAEARP